MTRLWALLAALWHSVSRLLDSHEFPVEGGKIVGVHIITVCANDHMCGFELSRRCAALAGGPWVSVGKDGWILLLRLVPAVVYSI
jgi:hypothetical protein